MFNLSPLKEKLLTMVGLAVGCVALNLVQFEVVANPASLKGQGIGDNETNFIITIVIFYYLHLLSFLKQLLLWKPKGCEVASCFWFVLCFDISFAI